VRQLLTVARKTKTHLAPTDANSFVLTISELIKQSFPKTITVALDLDPGLPPVMADSNQLSQALLNICVNARDAMPAGGKLTVRTEKIDHSKVPDRSLEARTESYVLIVISDTGMGMEEEVRERIFEPFFTTKGIGEGTGLGLAIVYGIVKEHNGFIDVESKPGHGTTFRLYLPALWSEGKPAVDEIMGGKAATHANVQGTVLVVEDEESMVCLLIEVLSKAGYQTLTAMDGEEAIDLYNQHKEEIDIVVLDLGLPKVTGFDVMRNLKEQNPGVSIIITTGYLQPELKPELLQAGVKDCIYKPYSIDDLVDKVGSLIEHSEHHPS
jgi:CheY-like chemotaxis protein